MDEPFISGYSRDVIAYLAAASIFQPWPKSRQILIHNLGADEPWMLILPILGCLAVGGKSTEAIPVAAAWVIMRHAANLIDDVQDGDFKPSNQIDRPENAITVAIAWIFSAFYLLNDPALGQEARKSVTTIFSRSGFDSSTGQYHDLINRAVDAQGMDQLQGYWSSVILKSGSIYRAGMEGGAAVGTDSTEKIEALGEFGTALGIIRQVIDDCRDLQIDTRKRGKRATLPLILQTLIDGQKPHKKVINQMPIQTSEPQLSGGLLAEGRIPEIIADVLLEWRRRALASLKVLEPSSARRGLADIIEHVLNLGSCPT